MSHNPRSSSGQFHQYREKLKRRRAGLEEAPAIASDGLHGSSMGKPTHRSRSFWTLVRAFWQLLRGHRGVMAVAVCTLSVSTLLGLLPLYGTKLVFDNVLDTKPLPREVSFLPLPTDQRRLLALVGIGMISIASVSIVVNVWGRFQTTRIGKLVGANYRRRVFDHAVRLPLHRVYELKSGGIASILREDAGAVGDLVFSMVYNPFRAIVQLLGSLVILAFVNWPLLLGGLLLLPTVWLTHRTWVNRIRPLYRDIRHTRQTIDARATESFGGMRIVRGFSRQRTESTSFMTRSHLMARQELYTWWWSRGIDIAWSILIPLASALLLWYGGSKVLHDTQLVRAGSLSPHSAFTTGDLVMFLAYLTALLGPIATLAESATGLQNQFAAFDRTLDLLDEPTEMPPQPDSIQLDRAAVAGRITMRNVSFSYPASRKKGRPADAAPAQMTDVLKDISLDVLPGQTIALVGPSGAGKTTLCNLIARFHDPTGGAIELDGVDLRRIDVQSYRRLLGIVEQDTFLFDGSIADNIAYGRRNATRQQIEDAARRANAHEFIQRIEDGYDAMIGERGVKLSGGQRQRLTIARAILADPRILILDEATSNLDTESERLIQDSLAALMMGRTCFVIAHRLSTVRDADHIVVIEHGRILEEGTHDELMSRSGRYRQMVELQTQPREEREVEPVPEPAEEPV